MADEHTINAQWLYSNALGGVRLRVPEEFVEQAHLLLNEDYAIDVENEQGYDSIQCSQCGSFNTEFLKAKKRGAYLVFLFLEFPLYPVEHEHTCRDCGHIEST